MVGGGVAGGEAGSPGVGSRLQTTRTTRRGKGLGPRGRGAHRSARTTQTPAGTEVQGERGEAAGDDGERHPRRPPPAQGQPKPPQAPRCKGREERPQATTADAPPRDPPQRKDNPRRHRGARGEAAGDDGEPRASGDPAGRRRLTGDAPDGETLGGGRESARAAVPQQQPGQPVMILPQVHLRKPCYDFYFL